jgi:hypothetical protein
MTRAYIVQHFRGRDETYDVVVNDIKNVNPDMIVVISLGEINVEYIFQTLFDGLNNWLIEHNKYMYVLWAGPDLSIRQNIKCVNTLGSAYGNYACAQGPSLTNNINLLATDKLFTSYNNNPKYERKYFVDKCVEADLIKEGIVTYRYPNVAVDPNYDWQFHDGSILSDEVDFVLNSSSQFSAGTLPKSYHRGFIDVVIETDSRNGYYIPTEKNAKPWGAMKPFLTISSQYYHKWLCEEYDMVLYDELFDYNFDNEVILEDRIHGVIQNLLSIRDKFNSNPEFKHEMYEKIKPKLIHNREKALSVFHTLKRKNKLIPECLSFITKEDNYELVGEVYNNKGHLHFITNKDWHLNPRLGI